MKGYPRNLVTVFLFAALIGLCAGSASANGYPSPRDANKFHLLDATIDQAQQAIASGQLTCTQLVELYLARIKAYNGSCVSPTTSAGQLGPVNLIANAGQVNALMTLNLRPAHRIAFGSTHIMPGVRPTSLMMIRICRMRLK